MSKAATDALNKILDVLHLLLITDLTYQGGKRALIEGVRTDKSVRGQGVGKAMLEWAINKAKEEGCHIVQLTTDKNDLTHWTFIRNLALLHHMRD